MIWSASVHGILLGAICVGSAIATKADKPSVDSDIVKLKMIHLIPENVIVTDDLIVNGGGAPEPAGEPAVSEPAPAPVVEPAPEPVAPPVQQPEVKTPKKKEPQKPKVEPKEEPQKPKVDPEKIKKEAEKKKKEAEAKKAAEDKRRREQIKKAEQDRATDAAEQRQKEEAQRKRQAAALQDALSDVKGDFHSGLANAEKGARSNVDSVKIGGASKGTISGNPGNGDGSGTGAAMMNYAAIVKSHYQHEWERAATDLEAADSTQTVVIEVVIRRDGTVLSKRIVKGSGNASLDKSVKTAMDNVRKLKA